MYFENNKSRTFFDTTCAYMFGHVLTCRADATSVRVFGLGLEFPIALAGKT